MSAITLPARPTSVTAARRFVREQLSNLAPDTLDELELMTSELASNALEHAGGSFVLDVERSADAVRVAVTDADRRLPVVRATDPSQGRGRGLHIVSRLASSWGVDERADEGGKTVWLTLKLPSDAPSVR